ncbi:CPBP family intramembrane metalloprotease [Actinoplanes sp. LDG1-06]|uniref:CPBP family intramembrane metalloprotease n=1 Tax=Paractinoplanes ovalisporus TaxID=2810368 RepID=A0ABS2ASK3_9ACTN|nr:type II CAAX endopeptidase family protein [Actinoplanes ovalisporus]MBM2622786.1 CPBP family intramembrane metalloprotease [Actinoplanes ovalisporus]
MDRRRPPHVVARIAIVFTAATLIWLAVFALSDALWGRGYDRGRHVASAFAISALVVPMVLLAYRRLDRVPWEKLRKARSRTASRLFGLGAAGYLIPAAVAVTACVLLGWLTIEPRGSVPVTILSALALIGLVFLYEALPEELVFRGYLYRTLVSVMPAWVAVFAQAALFTLFGVIIGAAGSVDRVVLFFGFAVVQGFIRQVTGSLWAPIGFHVAFQACEQLVGDAWNRFVVDDLALLQQFALGLIPLATAVGVIQLLQRRRTPVAADR